MDDAQHDGPHAATLPDGDVIAVLLTQHARIRELFARVRASATADREGLFAELRTLLVVHETAEEMVLRPVTKEADDAVASARNEEEAEATVVLKRLDALRVDDAEFDRLLDDLQQAVEQHAEAEELEEFPLILAARTQDERRTMGRQLLAAESIAPTHPHPSTAGSPTAQMLMGPFVSIADRTRDAIRAVLH